MKREMWTPMDALNKGREMSRLTDTTRTLTRHRQAPFFEWAEGYGRIGSTANTDQAPRPQLKCGVSVGEYVWDKRITNEIETISHLTSSSHRVVQWSERSAVGSRNQGPIDIWIQKLVINNDDKSSYLQLNSDSSVCCSRSHICLLYVLSQEHRKRKHNANPPPFLTTRCFSTFALTQGSHTCCLFFTFVLCKVPCW